ncbi:MAG TPA: tRNA (cytidine(34)-2'-O)-methyltransferase [Tepidisphaeraceae bacterium]|jgi:tRNA (cytidine/uridine-2'-O-)-methyltransferase
MTELHPHHLSIALLQPQIAPNTGNIARLCVATGTSLHLVRPLGFVLDDKNLRRSAMDYWPRVKLTVHDDEETFASAMRGKRLWLFTSRGEKSFWEAQFEDGDCLAFGNEMRGASAAMHDLCGECSLRIPQVSGERCLNLSTAAGIALFEALRQITAKANFAPDQP